MTTILATALVLKNKDAITELWNTLKKQIEKGALYSSKWFEKADVSSFNTTQCLVVILSSNYFFEREIERR